MIFHIFVGTTPIYPIDRANHISTGSYRPLAIDAMLYSTHYKLKMSAIRYISYQHIESACTVKTQQQFSKAIQCVSTTNTIQKQIRTLNPYNTKVDMLQHKRHPSIPTHQFCFIQCMLQSNSKELTFFFLPKG